MAQVDIFVNDVSYTITCDDGQEERLRDLGAFFDSHVRRLSEQVGNVPDSRLMLLAGLVISDELMEAKATIHNMEDGAGVTNTDYAVDLIKDATEKINQLREQTNAE